jgi:tRNA 5-methylaminomethyl-2-thiouridine biosynthesis bifunctional protein
MRAPLAPATPAFDAAGTPYSTEYGDIYHSADSGPGQARHVFLGGNDLPQRWAGAHNFTILESGFGLGLNFLATWAAWRADPARPQRLHFVSIEKHPFTRAGLATMQVRYPEFAPLAGELQAAWPLPLPGLHRLEFEGGRFVLTLALADVPDVLPRLNLSADAFYLDGFAPDRNPEMWSATAMRGLARLARPGTTLSTYTTARAVREALASAGFTPEQRPGFGRKRAMLTACFAPRDARRRRPAAAPEWSERRAVVIGAGLAGAAVSERLAARGWTIDLVERGAAPAAEASGIPAGVFHPQVSRDDSLLSRLTRAGYLYSLRRWRALEAAGHNLKWETCGVLQLAKDVREEARMAETTRTLGFPRDYLDYLPKASAQEKSRSGVNCGGWWFPESGWMEPAALVRAQLAAADRGSRLAVRYGTEVDSLTRDGTLWRARAADGTEIAAAPVVVLANSHDAGRIVPFGVPLKRVRGQLTRLPAGSLTVPVVLAGAGHLIPRGDGGAILGATFDYEDGSTEPRAEDHAGNLERLERLLPGSAARFDPATLDGAVGFRCVVADRLPLIGSLPDAASQRRNDRTRDLARLPGLYGAFAYGSRGLTWAALGGELIASAIEGEPLPIEDDLADAIDPARFLLRSARRGKPFRV